MIKSIKANDEWSIKFIQVCSNKCENNIYFIQSCIPVDIFYLIVLTFDLDHIKIVFRSKVVLPLSFYFLVH